MLNATFRPLTEWPGKRTPSYSRRQAPFKAGYQKTLDGLEREIGHLNGKSVVIQIALESRDIRNDGWPRSSARPKEPGVVVSFVTSKGPLSFPCDTYNAWEDNLRAITLSLEALRAVDRYGVTKHSEQYKGFAQIEAPGESSSMTVEQAAAFLSHWSGQAVNWKPWPYLPVVESAYRTAARKLHPDAGGNAAQFIELQRAKDILQSAAAKQGGAA